MPTGDFCKPWKLTLASSNGLFEIKFDTAADIDTDYAPLFYDKDNEGNLWGEIKDIQFVNDYMYKMVY